MSFLQRRIALVGRCRGGIDRTVFGGAYAGPWTSAGDGGRWGEKVTLAARGGRTSAGQAMESSKREERGQVKQGDKQRGEEGGHKRERGEEGWRSSLRVKPKSGITSQNGRLGAMGQAGSSALDLTR